MNFNFGAWTLNNNMLTISVCWKLYDGSLTNLTDFLIWSSADFNHLNCFIWSGDILLILHLSKFIHKLQIHTILMMFIFDNWNSLFLKLYIIGINITNGEEVAVKLESVKARHPQLLYESKLYKILQVIRTDTC